MSTINTNQIPPIAETVQGKTAIYDWQGLNTATCDLQYRPATLISLRDHFVIVALPMLASVLTIPVTYCFSNFVAPHISNWYCAIAMAGLGVILAAARQVSYLKKTRPREIRLIDPVAIEYLFVPAALWLAVAMLERIDQPANAYSYLLAVALPGVLIFADRVATHAVYWMTANARLDYKTPRVWRNDWRFRFTPFARLSIDEEDAGDPLLQHAFTVATQVRVFYYVGLVLIFSAVSIPSCIILATAHSCSRPTIGIELLTGIVFGLLIVALIRSNGRLAMLSTFCRHLRHWFCYDVKRTMPPWVFRSPCGSVKRRRMLTMLTVILLATPLYYLTSSSVLPLLTRNNMAVDCQLDGEGNNIQEQSKEPADAKYTLISLACLVVYAILIIVASIVVPVVSCFAAVFILIGPILWAYSNFLES